MEPRMKVLSEAEMLKIDQASRAVLREIGTLADNEQALDLLPAFVFHLSLRYVLWMELRSVG